MGDVGEYWRDHKEYKRDSKAADSLGVSIGQYRRDMRRMEREDAAVRKAAKIARHAVLCECGRTFLDVAAHNRHKTRWGKKAHKGTAIEPKVLPEAPMDDWLIF